VANDIHDRPTDAFQYYVEEMAKQVAASHNRAIGVKSRPRFCAKAIQLFLGRVTVDPIKRFCKTFFELQCKCNGAPSYESARHR
jgi:hypothetical protein